MFLLTSPVTASLITVLRRRFRWRPCSCSLVLVRTISCVAAPWRLASAWQCMALFSEALWTAAVCRLLSPPALVSLSRQIPRSGWTSSHHPQGGGVWWRPLVWGVLQRGGVLWRRQYAVRGPVLLLLLSQLCSASRKNQRTKFSLLVCPQVSDQWHRVWDSQRIPSPRRLLRWWWTASVPRLTEVTKETAASCHASRWLKNVNRTLSKALAVLAEVKYETNLPTSKYSV